MSQHIDSWLKQIDEVTNLFESDFAELNEEQLNWKPSQKSWSVAQVMEHLVIINSSYYPSIQQIKSGNYKLPVAAKVSFLVRQFGNIIYKSVQRDNHKKYKTMPVWKPDSTSISGDILMKFMDHQDELKDVISSCDDLLAQGVIISSPANRNIVYKLDRAFDIIVEHEFRHHGQALEIKAMLE